MDAQVAHPRATIIIVTYQSRESIGETLAPLTHATATGQIESIVVDNRSPDGSARWIAEHHPEVHLIESEVNLGFGNACNLGAEHAKSPYLVFLNPDAVLQTSELDKLVEFMEENPSVGICGPAIEGHHAGGLQTASTIVRNALRVGSNVDRRPLHPGDKPFSTDWLCGAVFLIRTSVFRDLSGFDPRFFMYFEETDLCLRTLQAGHEIWAVPTAVAKHEGGVSARKTNMTTQWGTVSKYYFESRFYYLIKHHGVVTAAVTEIIDILPPLARATASRLRLREVKPSGLTSRLAGGFLRLPKKP